MLYFVAAIFPIPLAFAAMGFGTTASCVPADSQLCYVCYVPLPSTGAKQTCVPLIS
jgi:hypothetical protein